ncbi:MAG: cobalamin biosynthesis protein, partial [Planctomycetes bacterium]|nr:cobalamin biosynthesis protein [Planctomycetota bacterium]
FKCSQFVQEKVNLPAVAQPAALLAGIRTRIVLPRAVYNHVTVAIAKESCLWSG